ncbi:hypothetical protein Fmac_018875 [Flemingia macrophylla]|uniref:Transducin/WD40 repeat-like superfamily protein n=1 Tax=Flemingia macrophylla TaxID=520843 RepID=A0ABD1M698_9FABA
MVYFRSFVYKKLFFFFPDDGSAAVLGAALLCVIHGAAVENTLFEDAPASFRISLSFIPSLIVKDTLSSWEPSHGVVSILQKFVSSDAAAFGSSRPLARPQSVVPGNGAIRSQLLGQPLFLHQKLSYIALKEGGNIPAEMAALFRIAMHQAADVGSGTRTGTESISPTNMRKSSGGSNVDLEPSQRPHKGIFTNFVDLCMAKEGVQNPKYKGFYTKEETDKALELDTIEPKVIKEALNPDPENCVSSVPAFSNDGKRLLVCSGSTVSVFSTATDSLVSSLKATPPLSPPLSCANLRLKLGENCVWPWQRRTGGAW